MHWLGSALFWPLNIVLDFLWALLHNVSQASQTVVWSF
jgi:hypothetical protein